MSSYSIVVILITMVAASLGQNTDPFDDAHNCELFRRCQDCRTLEYCVKLNPTWLQRWWQGCPSWAQYCNPYAQRCEADITPLCQTLLAESG